MPRRMMLTRSACVGSAPLGVVRTLYLPVVKLRGLGRKCGEAYPSPSPFSPWHCEQSKVERLARLPLGICPDVRAAARTNPVGTADNITIRTATHPSARGPISQEVIARGPPLWREASGR